MPCSDINYTQKRLSLRKPTETKEDPLVATFSSWRNQKKQVVSGFKTSFCRLDRLIHSSFKSIIQNAIEKSRLVSGFETPLCRSYRTHAFWETKMLLNSNFNGSFNECCGCGSSCLELIFDWVWVQKCVPLLFILQMLDMINDTTKDKNITASSLWNRILKIWDTLLELMQIETQWNKNYFIFHIFLLRAVGAFERNIDLEQEK